MDVLEKRLWDIFGKGTLSELLTRFILGEINRRETGTREEDIRRLKKGFLLLFPFIPSSFFILLSFFPLLPFFLIPYSFFHLPFSLFFLDRWMTDGRMGRMERTATFVSFFFHSSFSMEESDGEEDEHWHLEV
jgi:hypothetical protein